MLMFFRLWLGWFFFAVAVVSTGSAIQFYITSDKVGLPDTLVAMGIAVSFTFWQLLCFGFEKKPKPKS